jgi:hypothetical protein
MYIIDDICYADEMTEGIKVKTAKVLKGGIILVEFTTGEKRLFDTTILTGSVFEPLKDEKILSDMYIFHGVITWNNREIDIAPETVYEYSYPYCDVKSDYDVVNYNEHVTT